METRRAAPLVLITLILLPVLGFPAMGQYEVLLDQPPTHAMVELDGLPTALLARDAAGIYENISSCAQEPLASIARSIAETLSADTVYPDQYNSLQDQFAAEIASSILEGRTPLSSCSPEDTYRAVYISIGYLLLGSTLVNAREIPYSPSWDRAVALHNATLTALARIVPGIRVSIPLDLNTTMVEVNLTELAQYRLWSLYPPEYPPGLALLVTMINHGGQPESAAVARLLEDRRARFSAIALYTGPGPCQFAGNVTLMAGKLTPEIVVSFIYAYSWDWQEPDPAIGYSLMNACIDEFPRLDAWRRLVYIVADVDLWAASGGAVLGEAFVGSLAMHVSRVDDGGLFLVPPTVYINRMGVLHSVLAGLRNITVENLYMVLTPDPLFADSRELLLAEQLAGQTANLLAATLYNPEIVPVLAEDAAAYTSILARALGDEDAPLWIYLAITRAMVIVLMLDPTAPVDPYGLALAASQAGSRPAAEALPYIEAAEFDQALEALAAYTRSDPVALALTLAINNTRNILLPLPEEADQILAQAALDRETVITDPTVSIDRIAAAEPEEAVPIAASAVRAAGSLPEADLYNPVLSYYLARALHDVVMEDLWKDPARLDPVLEVLRDPTVSNPYIPQVEPTTTQPVQDPLPTVRQLAEQGDPEAAALYKVYPELVSQAVTQGSPDPATASLARDVAERYTTADVTNILRALEEIVGPQPSIEPGQGTPPAPSTAPTAPSTVQAGNIENMDPEQIARLIETLTAEGRVDEARLLYETLPDDVKAEILEIDPELPSLLERGVEPPGGLLDTGIDIDAPSPNLDLPAPSIGAPSLPAPSLGAGGGYEILLLGLALLLPLLFLFTGPPGRIGFRRRVARARKTLAKAAVREGQADAMTVREAVIKAYKDLLDALGKSYRGKLPWETHWEYDSQLPGDLEALHRDPARIFEKAKFSSKPVTREDLERMLAALDRALQPLRRKGRRVV